MFTQLLSTKDAAAALGVSVFTLYDWLKQSDAGRFVIRGQPVTIEYYQGGQRGQGRIQIDAQEIQRLLNLMRVSPARKVVRRTASKPKTLQHITATLGRPDD